ncbi:hypothetical protein HD554DRAFT_2038528 [Boletus coccyginus]|nr:hypothetical protein HD554DRAFT_2038528 [Boletus coccyginus]
MAISEVPGQASGTKGLSSSTNSASTDVVVKRGDKHQMSCNLLVMQAAEMSAKPKKTPKVLLKVMITEASKTITDSTNDNAIKLLHGKAPNCVSQYLKKKSLSGTIKGWVAIINEKMYPEAQGSINSSIIPNWSVSGAPSTSQATKVNTLTATTTTQCSGTNAGITIKFGGFNLNSDLEQKTTPFKNKEGKSNDNITLACVSSYHNSSVEIEEASQIPPWYSPHVPSASKRKMEEITLDSEPEGDEMVESDNHNIDPFAAGSIFMPGPIKVMGILKVQQLIWYLPGHFQYSFVLLIESPTIPIPPSQIFTIVQVLDFTICSVSSSIPSSFYYAIPRVTLSVTLLILALIPAMKQYTFYNITTALLQNIITISNTWQLFLALLCYTSICPIMPRFIISVRELYDRDLRARWQGIDSGFGVLSQPIAGGNAAVSAIGFADVTTGQEHGHEGDAEVIRLEVRGGAHQVVEGDTDNLGTIRLEVLEDEICLQRTFWQPVYQYGSILQKFPRATFMGALWKSAQWRLWLRGQTSNA